MKKKLLFMSYLGAALLSSCSSEDTKDISAGGDSFIPKVVFEIKDVTSGGEKDSVFIEASASWSSADLDYSIKSVSNLETSDLTWAARFPGAKFCMNDKQFIDISGKKTSKWELTTDKPVGTFAFSANFRTNTEKPVDFTYSYTVYRGDKVVDYVENKISISELPTEDEIKIVQ